MIDLRVHFGRVGRCNVTADWLTHYQSACGLEQICVAHAGAATHEAGGENLDEAVANSALVSLARDHSSWRPLYWLRPGRLDSNVHAFAGAVQSEAFVGVVLAPHLTDFELDERLLSPYLAVAALRRLPVLVLVGRTETSRPSRVAALARRFPNAPFVLCSAGGGASWSEAVDCVQRIQQRQDARLGLDTAGASQAEVQQAVAAVGPHSVYFASEAASDAESHIARAALLIKEIRAALGPADADCVLGANAARLLADVAPVEAARG